MSTQLTLNLPDGLAERIEAVAQRTGRSVNDFLAETIELTLRPWGDSLPEPISEASDNDVLRLSEKQLPETIDQRLSELLSDQQAATLSLVEQRELTALMQIYEEGLLRKAEAIREAVRRGLRGRVAS